MEHNNNMFGEYGENNILEDLVSGNGATSNYLSNETNQTFDGGFDILQQSLKAADILGAEEATDSPFDDLGLTFNGNSLSHVATSNETTVKNENEHFENFFDTSQFFNVPKTTAEVNQSQTNNNNGTSTSQHGSSGYQLSTTKQPVYQHVFSSTNLLQPTHQVCSNGDARTSSPNLISGMPRTASPGLQVASMPRTASPRLQVAGMQRTASPVLQVAGVQSNLISQRGITTGQRSASPNPPAAVSVAAPKQYNLFKIQISPKTDVVQTSKSYMLQAPPQSSQHLTTGNQTLLCNSSANKLNNVQVVKSVTQNLVSAPVMLSVARQQSDFQSTNAQVQHSTSFSPSNSASTFTKPLVQNNIVTNSLTLPSNINALNQEEQTNKLALLLQSKASQQSGVGKPAILKVGNQSINISNLKVAKALAANILQQHMRQQAVQQQQQPQVINVAKSQGPAFINLSNMQMQSPASVVASASQPQMKAQYVISSMAQSAQQALPVSQQQLEFSNKGSLAQSNLTVASTVKPQTQYVQLAISRNQVPINRIQIASVNIPISISTTKQSESVELASSSNTTQTVLTLPGTISSVANSSHFMQNRFGSVQSNTGIVSKNQLIDSNATIVNKDQVQKVWNQQNKASITVDGHTSSQVVLPNSSSNIASSTTQSKSNIHKSALSYVTFQVDPNLTDQQVEQVQQIISQKMSLSKIPTLSKEQKQLLAAFRAQLRTMETPVQQYYLRNPQLFLQKVYQQLQTGKPFIMHMRVDKSRLQNAQVSTTSSSGVVTQLVKEEHPTISLTSNFPRASSPSLGVKRSATPTPQIQSKAPKRQATEVSAVIQPSASMTPVKRPSLIMEQLQKHREIVCNPDITPFKTVRDAIRRLLPYHTCNTAEIKEPDFVESEPLYEDISKRLLQKMNSMLSKYHHLADKESTRKECSADVVMLQRAFLQSERAASLELKQKIMENPSAIREYMKEDQGGNALKTYFKAEGAPKSENIRDTNQSLTGVTDDLPVEAEKDVLLQEAVLSILSP